MTDAELADEIERALNVLQPLARSDTLFSAPNAAPGCELRFSTLREAIAALRSQPSSDQVLVPREPTDVIVWAICEHGESVRERCNRCPREIHIPGFDTGVQGCRAIAEEQYAAMLAAEAEGRKT